MRVGFIGLGHMGLPMTQRLAASEFPLTAWNRTSGRAAPLAATGTTLASSPAALAAGCDVVITMLSDAGAARGVLCGSDGVLSACRPGTITAAAKEFLDRACAAGFSDADFASVAQVLRPGAP